MISLDLTARLLMAARGTTTVHVPKALRSEVGELVVRRAGPDPLRISGILAGVLAEASLVAVRVRVARADPEALLTFAPPGPRRPDGGADARRRKALTMMREGLVSRALRCLGQSNSTAIQTAAELRGVRDHLIRLFPPARRPRQAGGRAAGASAAASSEGTLPEAAEPLKAVVREDGRPPKTMSRVRAAVAGPDEELWIETVKRAVFRARQRTAPGMTGTRHEHLAEPIRAPGGDALAWVVAEATDATLAGEADPVLLEGRLIPIATPTRPGGPMKIRPVVVGDTMLAVAKRIASGPLRAAAVPLFEKSAQHLETRDGCAVVARRVANAHARGWWVVALDVRNAFNCVDRTAVMHAVNDACPPVSAFVRWSLQTAKVRLAPDVEAIACESGVVQGCPLSPTLFALALRRARDRARDAGRGAPAGASATGPATRLEGLPDSIGTPAEDDDPADAAGATVYDAWYADDGHLVAPSPEAAAEIVGRLTQELKDIGLEMGAEKTRVLPPPDVPLAVAEALLRRPRCGAIATAQLTNMLVVLGTPVGDPAQVKEHVVRTAADACRRIAGYRALDAPFSELRALRWAGARSLLEHVAVQVPAIAFDEALHRRVEEAEVDAVRHILRHYGGPDADLAPSMRQVRLPVNMGGLGVRTLREVLVEDTTRPGFMRLRTPAEQLAADEEAARAHLSALGEEPDALEHLARYRELASDNGLAIRWIADNNPFVIDPRRDPNLEAAALALILGRPVLEGIDPTTPCTRGCRRSCRGVSTVPCLDPLGKHILACSSLSTTKRHDAARDALFTRLTAWFGRARVRREVGIDADGNLITRGAGQPRGGDTFPGDVHVDLGQQKVFLDVVVRDTWAKDLVHKAAKRGSAAAEAGFDSKTENPQKRQMAQQLKERGMRFQPMALGAFGGVNCHALSWLREAAKMHENGTVLNAMPAHKRRNGAPPLWKQAACELSMAVVMAHAAAATHVRECLRGTSGASLRTWPVIAWEPPEEPETTGLDEDATAAESGGPREHPPPGRRATGTGGRGRGRTTTAAGRSNGARPNVTPGRTAAGGGQPTRRAQRRAPSSSTSSSSAEGGSSTTSSESTSSSSTTSPTASSGSTSDSSEDPRRETDARRGRAPGRGRGRPPENRGSTRSAENGKMMSGRRTTKPQVREEEAAGEDEEEEEEVGEQGEGEEADRGGGAVAGTKRNGQTNQQRCSSTFQKVATSPAARSPLFRVAHGLLSAVTAESTSLPRRTAQRPSRSGVG